MKQKLKEMIILTANEYQRTMNAQLLAIYLEDFKNFDEDQVINAFRQYRKDSKNNFFPRPAQIIELIQPTASPEAQAIESVNRILLAINRFGYPNPTEAKEFIGELGWLVVKDYGGWDSLCANMGVEYSEQTFRAQARDSIKSKMNLAKAGVLNQPIGLTGREETKSLNAPQGGIAGLISSTVKEIPK